MDRKEWIKDVIYVVLGNLVLSIGVSFFLVPNSILSGGVAGIAIALKPIIPISVEMMINILTFGFFFIGLLVLGKKFAIKTVLSTILYPTFLALTSMAAQEFTITSDPILASIYGGVFLGMGVGLVFRTGASTGGMDIPPLIINKYTHIPLATLVLIVDGLTVLLGMSIHGIEPALIGLISVWVSAYMVDKTMMAGSAKAKSLMIMSEKFEGILHAISTELDRGSTILHAEGGYTREKRPVLMIVIVKKQFPVVNKIIQHIDPCAFVVVHDVNEVQGEGFTFDEGWNGE